MAHSAAVILDGGFVKKKLQDTLRRFPTPDDIVALVAATMAKPRLASAEVYRVLYYDAPPFEGQTRNPVDGSILDFSTTPQARLNRQLIDSLELKPDFAVRRGMIIHTGWKLGRAALRSLSKKPRAVTAQDFVPDMGQKGVDIKIGLDIALLSVKRIVDTIVLITGDSDFVPVMKFARTEGIKVYLEPMGHGIRRELKAHADFVL
jgi:uncharacterized LabA/DUF88 family protein